MSLLQSMTSQGESQMRNRVIAVVTLALCVGTAAVPAQAAAQGGMGEPPVAKGLHTTVSDSYTYFCDDGTYKLCVRDPSDGGAGTRVRMSDYSGDNAMNWVTDIDTKMCGGFVTSDCPSQLLGSRYDGDVIEVIKNEGSGYCLGANASNSFYVMMRTCGDADTVFIASLPPNGCNYCYTVSVDYSDAEGTIGWLCGSDSNDAEPYVGSCSPADLSEWTPGWA
jgi:hypothetical protein